MRKIRSSSTIESKIIKNGRNKLYAIRLLPSSGPDTKFIYIKESALKPAIEKLINASRHDSKSSRVTIEGKYNRLTAYLIIEFNPGQESRFRFCFSLQERQVTSDINYIQQIIEAPKEQGIGNTA